MSELIKLTVAELADGLKKRDFSSEDVTRAYIAQISQRDPDVGAYITVTEESALDSARAVDAARANGETLHTLAGIPAGIKDNICTRGVPTTCASRILDGFRPPYDATAAELLAESKTVVLGKLNMDEFEIGAPSETAWVRPARNPHDLEPMPEGASGGSAAAVAAGEAAFALGSDTGGSVRRSAAYCGVVGMKPTYGAVSRYGLIAFASSLDQISPLTKTVRDSAMVMEAIVARDPKDATSLQYESTDFTAHLERGVKGMRIGILKAFFGDNAAPDVKDAVLSAAKVYERLGAHIDEISLPTADYALPAYYVLSAAEASSNLGRFDGIKYGFRAAEYGDINDLIKETRRQGFGAEVKRRIMAGSLFLSAGYYDAYYKKAMQVRTLLRREMDAAFEKCDVILSPVNPLENSVGIINSGDAFTVPASLAGIPALSLPCGTDSRGLPVGMQLMGRRFDETLLYRAAYAFETERGHA